MRLLLWYWGRRGGGARILYELTRALSDLPDVTPVLAINRDNELGPALHQLGLTIRADRLPGFINLPGPTSLGHFARTEKIDAAIQVMAHPLSVAATVSLRAARIPTIEFVHDAMPHPGDRSPVYDLSARLSRSLSHQLIAQSDHVRRQLRAQLGTRTKPIATIGHGPLYAHRERGIVTPGRVLFAGRIRAYKGIELLLAAWPKVLQSCPDAQLVIAGEGDLTRQRAQIEECAATVINRWLSDEELPTLVGSAQVLVLPYQEASQSGIATIARSMGVAVVATDVGGLAEQIRDGHDGRVVAPEAGALSAGIIEWLQRPALSPDAETVAPGRPTWPEIAAQLTEIAARLIPSGPFREPSGVPLR